MVEILTNFCLAFLSYVILFYVSMIIVYINDKQVIKNYLLNKDNEEYVSIYYTHMLRPFSILVIIQFFIFISLI